MNGMQNIYGSNDSVPYKSLQDALALVKQAVQGEREDELFYSYLISLAPTQEEKDIITDIRNDEKNHNKMFREIYTFFTGEELPVTDNLQFKEPSSYIEGIKRAFFGELGAMERYRNIRAGLPVEYYRDMVFEILTDELKHADKYNYILNLNTGISDQVTPMHNVDDYVEDNKDGEETQYTADQLITFITPLVNSALEEVKEVNEDNVLEHIFRKYIFSGVLVGIGFTPEDALQEVEYLEKSGESKMLRER